MKKTLLALAAAAGFAMAAPASAIVVGGIDFGAEGGAPLMRHLDTATLAQSYISGNGQNATAYGYVTSINGDTTYCAGGGSCGLFYVATFTNSQDWQTTTIPSFGDFTTVGFESATVQLFFASDAGAINLLNQSSPTNLGLIQAMTPWATLVNHGTITASGKLTGATLTGNADGLLAVDAAGAGIAEVIAFLDGNSEADGVGGFADIAYTASFNNSQLNDKDVQAGLTAGCGIGQAQAGAWCYQGTSNMRGDTVVQVPVPAPLSLLGIGLLGLGFASRRKA